MLQLFGTNSKNYLPALENPEKIQEVTDLVILILQILTKKVIPSLTISQIFVWLLL